MKREAQNKVHLCDTYAVAVEEALKVTLVGELVAEVPMTISCSPPVVSVCCPLPLSRLHLPGAEVCPVQDCTN